LRRIAQARREGAYKLAEHAAWVFVLPCGGKTPQSEKSPRAQKKGSEPAAGEMGHLSSQLPSEQLLPAFGHVEELPPCVAPPIAPPMSEPRASAA